VNRVVILGGGVGGTLVANLLVRKLRHDIDRREASVTLIDERGQHVYQPGFMYIAMGGERAEFLFRLARTTRFLARTNRFGGKRRELLYCRHDAVAFRTRAVCRAVCRAIRAGARPIPPMREGVQVK